jgi:hypothetical protein
MDLDEANVPRLFEMEPSQRRTSLSTLKLYEQPAMAGDLPPPISLEKDWLSLHFLLTGELRPGASPLSRSVLGGAAIGEELGEGPARYLWADEVREISAALSALTHDELRRRYDPAALKATWPATPIADDEDEEELFDGLVRSFDLLATYYEIAATRGNAMLIAVV